MTIYYQYGIDFYQILKVLSEFLQHYYFLHDIIVVLVKRNVVSQMGSLEQWDRRGHAVIGQTVRWL